MIADCTDQESVVPFATSWFLKWRKVFFWIVFALALALFGYRSSLGERVLAPSVAHAANEHPVSNKEQALLSSTPNGTPSSHGGMPQGALFPPHAESRNGAKPPAEAESANRVDSLERAESPRGMESPREATAPNGAVAPSGAAAQTRTESPQEPGAEKQGITADGRVILNLATEAEFRKLPGIGKSRARAIVEYRTRIGRFRRIEDLLRVKGIGRRRLTQLRPKILLDNPLEQSSKN